MMAGCASQKPHSGIKPEAELAVANVAVSDASAAGAAQYAPVELNSAQSRLALANKAVAANNYDLAKNLAVESQADAKLALSKTNASKAQIAAEAVQRGDSVLREELDRVNH